MLARVGVYLYGLATVAAGLLDLAWGEFEGAHQPIQALGDHIPGRSFLAYLTAAGMIGAGLAVLWRRTARIGALVSGLIYFVFGLFWLPRFYSAPQVMGFHLTVFIGLLGGLLMQWVVAAGGLLLYGSSTPSDVSWQRTVTLVARWAFGLGSIFFGLRHLTQVEPVARMIPDWLPFGGSFWAILTGVAFVAAGVAILSEILNVWASRLLAAMVLLFEVALVPIVWAHPDHHIAWGSNAYNLAAAGAITLFAASKQ